MVNQNLFGVGRLGLEDCFEVLGQSNIISPV